MPWTGYGPVPPPLPIRLGRGGGAGPGPRASSPGPPGGCGRRAPRPAPACTHELRWRKKKNAIQRGFVKWLVQDLHSNTQMGSSPTQVFYGLQAALTIFAYIFVRLTGGGDLYDHVRTMSVATRPSWAPSQMLLVLHRKHIFYALCYGSPVAFLVAAAFYDVFAVRFMLAGVASLQALAETAVTGWHKDHAMVYNVFALVLLSEEHAQGFALGVCVHFIASSGWAKLCIGGWNWVHPETMRAYLRTYSKYSLQEGGPAIPALNRMMRRHDTCLVAISVVTLFIECLCPLALLMPPGILRIGFALSMIALHLGIFFVQSTWIGILFLPCTATYYLGFASDLPLGSSGWWVAVAVCMVSLATVCATRRPLPENWPLSPFALFRFSFKQWNLLEQHFVLGRTRLVLSTDLECNPVGLPIRKRGIRGGRDKLVSVHVYDGWYLCIDETVHHHAFVEILDFEAMAGRRHQADADWASDFISKTEAWLQSKQQLIELSTGRPLLRAHFVELDSSGFVGRVLASSSSSSGGGSGGGGGGGGGGGAERG